MKYQANRKCFVKPILENNNETLGEAMLLDGLEVVLQPVHVERPVGILEGPHDFKNTSIALYRSSTGELVLLTSRNQPDSLFNPMKYIIYAEVLTPDPRDHLKGLLIERGYSE